MIVIAGIGISECQPYSVFQAKVGFANPGTIVIIGCESCTPGQRRGRNTFGVCYETVPRGFPLRSATPGWNTRYLWHRELTIILDMVMIKELYA